jgi:hypothetical protein
MRKKTMCDFCDFDSEEIVCIVGGSYVACKECSLKYFNGENENEEMIEYSTEPTILFFLSVIMPDGEQFSHSHEVNLKFLVASQFLEIPLNATIEIMKTQIIERVLLRINLLKSLLKVVK